jgi:ABC-type uncharacterized transport system involved in gliding motility auxiliary subunit
MQLNRKTRLQLKIQSALFVALYVGVIGLLAWLTTQYYFTIDLTANQRNSLSNETIRLLGRIEQPVSVTAFVNPANESKANIDTLFERYHEQLPLLEYESINPDFAPDLLRQHNIQRDGEIVIEVGERRENLSSITEATVTNAIARLLRQGERWAVFLEGHGERDPYGQANFDIQLFAARMATKGFNIETVNLLQTTAIPANTDILVIADPADALLPGETQLIGQYIRDGGNLLWLADLQSQPPLDALAETLDIEFLPGVVVDTSAQILGLSRVDFALVADYPRHAITTAIDSLTLFPRARAMTFHGEEGEWLAEPILATQPRSWNETGELEGRINQGDNSAETAGPLTLGYALSRSLQDDAGNLSTQRILVTGDADFLSNQYLGNGANLELGLNMFNWLSHDDNLIAISPRSAPDTRLELSDNAQLAIAALFLLLLPLSLLATGIRIWLLRRSR